MKTISIQSSKPYDLIIGKSLIRDLGIYACNTITPKRAVLITDSNVWSIYGTTAASGLSQAGFNVIDYILPAGENSKTGEQYLKLLNYLADNHIQHGDIVIGLGGGVVCDICGFVCATYLHGIPYILVPTTLIAMIDSSVSGDCSINLNAGKNIVGASHPPALVICDTQVLDTLPDSEMRDGCAEVVKYSILFDPDLFSHLQDNVIQFDRSYTIERCVQLKNNAMLSAETDHLLQLGYTIGHAIEITDHYTISHGKAIALGIAAASRISKNLGFCTNDLSDSIQRLLKAFYLPIGSAHTAEDILDNVMSNPKYIDGNINLILPAEIGKCIIHTVNHFELKSLLEYNL